MGASVAGPGCRIGCSVQVGLLEGGHPGVEKGKDSTAGTVQVTDGAAGKIQTVWCTWHAAHCSHTSGEP